MNNLYLFVKYKFALLLVLREVDGAFQTILWYQHLKGILPNKQQVAFFVLYTILEKQLQKENEKIKRHNTETLL